MTTLPTSNTNLLETLIDQGYIYYEPLVYEDFLPVSAAGIFQSNLGEKTQGHFSEHSSRDAFERDLGVPVFDELALYQETQRRSLVDCAQALNLPALLQNQTD